MPQTADPPTLPAVLAGAREVGIAAYILDVGNVARLALTPDEVAPLLGLSAGQVRDLCRAGTIRARNLYPGSKNGRYAIPIGSLVEWLSGRDDPVSSVS